LNDTKDPTSNEVALERLSSSIEAPDEAAMRMWDRNTAGGDPEAVVAVTCCPANSQYKMAKTRQ
jgi:hypothetical protein